MLSREGAAILKEFEGFEAKPYRDVKGVPTIGYGATMYEDGTPVKMTDKPITEDKAIALMYKHLEKEVFPYIRKYITQPLNKNQMDALAIFIYNIGATAFKNSTVLKRIIARDTPERIKEAWCMWNKSGGKVVNGLVRRREAEIALYFKPTNNAETRPQSGPYLSA